MSDGRVGIERLIFTYAERMDAGDFAGVAALFENASYGAAGQPGLSGSEQIRRVLDGMVILYDGIPRTKHVSTNVQIEIDERNATATSRSYFSVLQSVRSGSIQVVAAGRYHDRFERVEGAWRFVERQILMDLLGDLSEHLRAAPVRS
jgi:3-phenylpropionate/cinnamic acid dioxygenase small subunit